MLASRWGENIRGANVGSAISLRTGTATAVAASARIGGWDAGELTRLPDLTAAASLSRDGVPTEPFTLYVDHFDLVAADGWNRDRIAHAAV